MDAPGLTELLDTAPAAPTEEPAQPQTTENGITLQGLQRLLYGSNSPLTKDQRSQLSAMLYQIYQSGKDETGLFGIKTGEGASKTEQLGSLQQAFKGDNFGWLHDLLGTSGGAYAAGPGPQIQVKPPEGLQWQSGLQTGGGTAWAREPEAPSLSSQEQGKAISPFREREQKAFTPPAATQRGQLFGVEQTAPLFAPGATAPESEFNIDEMFKRYNKLPLFQPTMNLGNKEMGWSSGLGANYQLSNLI